VIRPARALIAAVACFWVVAAFAYPLTTEDWRPARLIGALLLGLGVGALGLVARGAPRAGGGLLAGVAAVLWVGILVGDDDARHLRALLFAGLYPQAPGREEYAFHGPGAWGWPTALLVCAVAGLSVAAVALLLGGRREAMRSASRSGAPVR
jgi:hypothetical protein